MEEVQLPVIDHTNVAQVFLVNCGFFLRRVLVHGIERNGLRRSADVEYFFTRSEEIEIFLCILVFVLRRLSVPEFHVATHDIVTELVIALLHHNQLLIEEDVLVIRQCQAERHQTDDDETAHNDHPLRNGGDVVVLHGMSIYSSEVKIFCSGIGGIGLSAYASHMRASGHDVLGSDRAASPLIDDLRSQGILVHTKQVGSGIPGDVDLFVYSEAIPEDSPERAEAKRRGVKQQSYFQALGELTAGSNLIAVCGTHGKSTTTAMAIGVLTETGLDPNAIVGTKLSFLDGQNWRRGATDLWIVEACEYRRSFLFLKPTIVLLTNADGDHFDAFKDAQDYRSAFVEFLSGMPKDGIVIAHGSDEQSRMILESSKKSFIDADLEDLPVLSIPGMHMRKNAQLVAALGKHLALDESVVKKSLREYAGSWRRMEVKGTKSGITVIDDYAHHPVEIRATLSAMKEAYPGRRIVAVFQPHTHDRTLKLWDDFAKSFQDADEILISSVYDARPDKDSERVDEKKFAEAVEKESKKPCKASGGIEKTEQILCSEVLKAGDVVVVMGAGNITKLSDDLMRNL